MQLKRLGRHPNTLLLRFFSSKKPQVRSAAPTRTNKTPVAKQEADLNLPLKSRLKDYPAIELDKARQLLNVGPDATVSEIHISYLKHGKTAFLPSQKSQSILFYWQYGTTK